MAIQKTLKVTDEPTMWNKEMAIGTLLFPIVGTIIGGIIGKNRMRDEKEHGRPVTNDPSAWNKDTLLGGLLGSLAGATIGGMVGVIVAGMTMNPVLGMVANAAISLAGIVAGGMIGAKAGQSRQINDFSQAVHQEHESKVKHAMGREREPQKSSGKEYAPTIEQEQNQPALKSR